MSKYLEQIERIKSKLPIAKRNDPNFKVFGSNQHKYLVNKPASHKKIADFEEKYSINLPECYTSFISEIGNGGVSFMNSAAGPFFGIFPLGNNTAELVENPERYLSNNCILRPDLSDEYWVKLNKNIEGNENISDEEYELEKGKIFGGILPIGSQGCTYVHGIILNGDYKGRVVNIDMDYQKPRFTHEANFLDWYERWLDEVIDGTLRQDGPSWFGYGIGGEAENLFSKFKKNSSKEEKLNILYAILGKSNLNSNLLKKIEDSYKLDPTNHILLEILVKFDYKRSKKYLSKLIEINFIETARIIRLNALEKGLDWIESIDKNIHLIKSNDDYLHVRKILESSKTNFGKIIIPLLKSSEKDLRSSVINTLGNLEQKHQYISEYKIGLEDPEISVVHHSLGALYECNESTLLPFYKKVLERLSNKTDHLEKLTYHSLERNLKLFNMTTEQLAGYKGNNDSKRSYFKFWK